MTYFFKVSDKNDDTFSAIVAFFYATPHLTLNAGGFIRVMLRLGQGVGIDNCLLVFGCLCQQSCVRKFAAGAFELNLPITNLFEEADMELEAKR